MPPAEGLLGSDEVPQANVLERVVERVRARAGGEPVASLPADQPRDVNYYDQAARILRLLDGSGAPSDSGLVIVAVSGEALTRKLVVALSSSPVGARWIRWTGATSLAAVDPESAEEFLLACSALSPATARRRAGTLRHWWRTLFMPPRPASVPPLERLTGLPHDEREVFERLLREPLIPMPDIWALIDAHVASIARISHINEFVDLSEARTLAERLRTLAERVDFDHEGPRRLWQAAACYFLLVEDADTDFDIGGLDDDLAVFNAVARHLGHPDLMIGTT